MKQLLKSILPHPVLLAIRYVRRQADSLLERARAKRERALKRRYALPRVSLDTLIPGVVDIMPPILDDICLPPYLGTRDHDDLTPLMSIVRARQPQIVLELGTAHGNTVANICRQSDRTKVYTVNAPAELQSGSTVTYELAREEIGRVYKANNFQHRVVQIFQNTLYLDLSPYMEPQSVDIAIIDACHDADYVTNDFHKVRPFIKPQGIVLFHDTQLSLPKRHSDSYLACAKLRRDGYDIQVIKNTWWGVWINDVPQRASA